MTEKRCTDCKYTKGIGYDFWCGEGHTEYEVFGAETNCPYYEYHDWSKGTPSRTEKRFTTVELPKPNRWGIWYDGAYLSTYQVCILLNEYVDVKKENEQLRKKIAKTEKIKQQRDFYYARLQRIIKIANGDFE